MLLHLNPGELLTTTRSVPRRLYLDRPVPHAIAEQERCVREVVRYIHANLVRAGNVRASLSKDRQMRWDCQRIIAGVRNTSQAAACPLLSVPARRSRITQGRQHER